MLSTWIARSPDSVSLLVRLWVEMNRDIDAALSGSSASLWGCELKYLCISHALAAERVSLLVRLWVEMNFLYRKSTPEGGQPPCEAVSWNANAGWSALNTSSSASLWGCELKYNKKYFRWKSNSQPPCEAVSWNGLDFGFEESYNASASLWGCELKYCTTITIPVEFSSASLWGCELKLASLGIKPPTQNVSLLVRLWVEMPFLSGNQYLYQCQPPCEAVSWNISFLESSTDMFRQPPCEAVSWNSGVKVTKAIINVSLLVRLWVEISLSGYSYQQHSGQPPCEAVSWNTGCPAHGTPEGGQPPCEAVSWNKQLN